MRLFQDGQLIRKLYLCTAGAGLLLGFVGYLEHYGWDIKTVPGVTLLALHHFFPRPQIVLDSSMNSLVRLGAFLCGISGFIAAGLLWIAAANRSVAGLFTQFFRRGHTLVLGGGDFARRFADSLSKDGLGVVHAIPPGDARQQDAPPAHRITVPGQPETLANKAGLLRAKQLVIDIGKDTDSLACATGILSYLSAKPKAELEHLAIRVADPVLSDQFFDVVSRHRHAGFPFLSVFDENLILARHALAQDPLFMRAAARGQSRVHAMIVGFGGLGEKLLDQVMLTSVARGLESPRISVLDRDAGALQQAFEARRPRVLSQLPIAFHEVNIGKDAFENGNLTPQVAALLQAEAEDPFTMIYLALPDQGEVTKAALLLDRLRQRTGAFSAPIAYRCKLATENTDFLANEKPNLSADHGFLRICVPSQDVAQAILGVAQSDRIAVQIHETYRSSGQASPDADQPWAQLKDTYKRSNRRTLDHLPAKLWTAGVRPEPGADLTPTDRKILQQLLDGPDDSEMMMQLAQLEHERWCIDRQLDGWTYAETRDNVRRHHDRLVPFDDLRKWPGEVEKDIGHIRELMGIVLSAPAG